MEGNYDQAVSGVLVVEIGGLDNSDPLNPQFDALHVMGAASLAGTLEVSLIDAFLPDTPDPIDGGNGDSFTILTADQMSGSFGTVTGLDYDNAVETGRELRLAQTSTDISLTAFQATYGDGNMNRQLDSAGKFNHPELGPASWLEGDYSGDDLVNSTDLFLMLEAAKFNQGPYAASPATASVDSVSVDDSLGDSVTADGQQTSHSSQLLVAPADETATVQPAIATTS